MVVIRLSRGGAKARPFFNIVVADKRTRRDGRFIERIGFYNPIATANEERIRVAQDRMTYWKSVGAQASPTVERLLAQASAAPAAASAPAAA
ncbi:MAG: 30S ribosomal protein S16 [Burkholderiaceae bacterium]